MIGLRKMDWMLVLSGQQEYEKGWQKMDESTYQYDEDGEIDKFTTKSGKYLELMGAIIEV